MVEHPRSTVLPIEVKSGKTYKRHSALRKVLSVDNYGMRKGLVLCEANIEAEGDVLHAPLYCLMFIENGE